MKIAHVTATFPPYRGGTGTVCYYNAVEMARRGHTVDVYTASAVTEASTVSVSLPDDPPEISVYRLPVAFRIGNAPLLPRLMSLRGYDLIHLHYPFVFGQEMIYLRRLLRGCRYVITYHQDLILNGMIGSGVRMHEALLGRQILKAADRLMFTSLDYGRSSRVAGLFDQIPEKITAMPNGVDADRFCPDIDASDLRARYHLKDSERVILFVGGLDTPHYFKGVPVLLKSFAQVIAAESAGPDSVRLLIVGDGDLRPQYEQQAQALGITDHVTFCGRVSDDELPLHYALCDLHVLPSTTMGEAFGVVLLEAMAAAKPVIASSLPGVRTVVHDQVDGLLVRPGDADDLALALAHLLESAERRREMGANGRRKVLAEYTWSAIAPRLEQVYTEAMTHAAV